MAGIVFKEIAKKKKKALVYAGQYHSATRYYHPLYDFEKNRVIKINKSCMGNLVHRRIPERIFNICLHYPWPTFEGQTDFNYPVGGVIDTVMDEFADKRVGFDVRDSPFGELRDDSTLHTAGYDEFELSDFCDGHVLQKHFRDYEGCAVDPLFVTEENLREARQYLPNPRLKTVFKSPQGFLAFMKAKVDVQRRFGGLE